MQKNFLLACRHLCLLLLIAVLSACVTVDSHPKPEGFRFNTLEVMNRTRDDIFNMRIEVTKFHRKFACGIILQGSLCMNGFHERALEGNDIVISWEQGNARVPHRIGPLSVSAPDAYDAEQVYALQFVFTAPDRVELAFRRSTY